MIACACGNDSVWENGQLNVNVFACEWMSEWSVDWMTVAVLHRLCATHVENSYSQLTMRYIYYYKSMYERENTEKQKTRDFETGIKSLQYGRLFLALAWLNGKYSNTTANHNKNQQHYTGNTHMHEHTHISRMWRLVTEYVTSCQPHRVTSGHSNSVIYKFTLQTLLVHIHKPFLKSIHENCPYTNIKQNTHTQT